MVLHLLWRALLVALGWTVALLRVSLLRVSLLRIAATATVAVETYISDCSCIT